MSITKVLTALLLTDMAAHGDVRFDDPVAKYLPFTGSGYGLFKRERSCRVCIAPAQTPLGASFARLLETRRPTPLAGTNAGLGWFITSDEKEKIIWKSGLSGGCNTYLGFSTQKRRGALVLSNFLWRPIDEGTIHIGMKLINPDFHPGDFNALYSNS